MKKILILFLILTLFYSPVFAAKKEYSEGQTQAQKELKDSKVSFKERSFYYAARRGDIETVNKFLKAGINPDSAFMGYTVLGIAVDKKRNDIVELLLENGANPSKTSSSIPPIEIASQKNNLKAAKLLIEYGADVKKTIYGATPLEMAITRKQPEMARLLYLTGSPCNEYAKLSAKNSKNLAMRNIFDGQVVFSDLEIKPKTANTNLVGNVEINIDKKDPKLIYVYKTPVIDNRLFKQKLETDNIEYVKYKAQLSKEQYKVYKITEKIIRANNLEYQNWRIGFNLNPEEINASASTANLILINSSLYDSLHHNDDALAFIIAHELAHFILGHHQISLENNYKIQQSQIQSANLSSMANQQNQLSAINNAYGNSYAALGNSISGLGYGIAAANLQKLIDSIYTQERDLELMADNEAMVLMSRANYNLKNATEAFDFLLNVPNLYTSRGTHPPVQHRIMNTNKQLNQNNESELINQGKQNIYNSPVLSCYKSMDNKTLVINKPDNFKKIVYVPESQENKFLRLAYTEYAKNNMNQAIEYFTNASSFNSLNYVTPLYISYSYEYLYNKNNNREDLRQAIKWAKKAFVLNSSDEHTKKQIDELKNIASKK